MSSKSDGLQGVVHEEPPHFYYWYTSATRTVTSGGRMEGTATAVFQDTVGNLSMLQETFSNEGVRLRKF